MNRKLLLLLAAAAVAGIVTAAVSATPPSGPPLTNVPNANTKSVGYAPPDILSPELQQTAVAQGSTRVENPAQIPGPTNISYYGYDNDLLNAAGQPVMVPTGGFTNEAHKTEPDKNTYLVFKNGLPGADPSYDYGTHFLFQGHETGSPGYITRINLDADATHRVTLLATADATGKPIADIDGSTWDPWAKRLLFTTENVNAPTYAATPGYPSTVTDVSGALGRGGYEGIQNDSAGDIWIVEDRGGAFKPTEPPTDPPTSTTAKSPFSYLYRYVPDTPGDLQNGKLEALQVLNADGDPITFDSQKPLNSADQVALHTYGNSFDSKWVVVHNTATDGNTPFNATDAARAADATPFKRPENGQFKPVSGFTQFFFDETGDTDATSPENAVGGWGSVFKLTQSSPTADTGSLTLFYKETEATAGFDNVTFISRDAVTFVQDAGDGLHGQANALDSGWVFDTNVDYSNPANQPLRWLAEGRDPSATLDSGSGGFATKNEGDNEITGVHVSNGDASPNGILGAQNPNLYSPQWRWFWTQQHGDNTTWEVTLANK